MDEMYSRIKYRLMTLADVDAVVRVEQECFAIPWSRESFWQDVLQDKTHYMVAVQEDTAEIIGYVGIWLLGYEGHITNVAISPRHRQAGIGYALLQALISDLKSLNITSITLEVRPSNIAAVHLYQKLGFRSVGQRPHYYEDGEAAEIMWKTQL